MYLGYNTNGFAHHRLADTLAILAEIGYQGVALTFDHATIDPHASDAVSKARQVGQQCRELGLRCVVETGARFLLDPRRKHQPTLISPSPEERRARIEFLERSIALAPELGADTVSFWSGTPVDQAPEAEHFGRLRAGIETLLSAAEPLKVRLAFEPEPGMLIATTAQAASLVDQIGHPLVGLTIDVGHVHCQEEGEIPQVLERSAGQLFNVHVEDMRRGKHEHLPFGEGEMDFPPILETLARIGYTGGVFVELSRHGHDAVRTARRAFEFLRSIWPTGPVEPG